MDIIYNAGHTWSSAPSTWTISFAVGLFSILGSTHCRAMAIQSFTCWLYFSTCIYFDVDSNLFFQLPSTYAFATLSKSDGIDGKARIIQLTFFVNFCKDVAILSRLSCWKSG
jgi:hypothetical protein